MPLLDVVAVQYRLSKEGTATVYAACEIGMCIMLLLGYAWLYWWGQQEGRTVGHSAITADDYTLAPLAFMVNDLNNSSSDAESKLLAFLLVRPMKHCPHTLSVSLDSRLRR
jgi:hypothetical protein